MFRTKIGIIGTGNISPKNIEVCQSLAMLDLVACADLNLEKTPRVAEIYGSQGTLSLPDSNTFNLWWTSAIMVRRKK